MIIVTTMKFPKHNENWSEGCVRKSPLSCDDKENDVFLDFSHSKFPGIAQYS
ncbi:hypothetical protein CsatB_027994 [Cannabis sativa]